MTDRLTTSHLTPPPAGTHAQDYLLDHFDDLIRDAVERASHEQIMLIKDDLTHLHVIIDYLSDLTDLADDTID